jgi:hypothetical protein
MTGVGRIDWSASERLWDEGRSLLRAYGLMGLPSAEAKARAGVLDRMGAFAPGEYDTLMRFLSASAEELGL